METRITEFDVAIIADGNSGIGMGHIMRCSAIADALGDIGVKTCFIHSDDSVVETVRSLGFESFVLHSDYRKLSEQGIEIKKILREHRISFSFFDSYYASNELFKEIHKCCKTGCFGYGKNYYEGLDLIVPYGVSSDPKWYQATFDPNITTVLFGAKYVPLRRPFWSISEKNTENPEKRILLTSGGSDPLNVTGNLIQKIRKSGISDPVDVVAGKFFDIDALKMEFESDANVIIHQGLTDLSPLMKRAVVAISAGGMTLYELMASSVTTVAYAFADNQLGNKMLSGAIIWCGDVRKDSALNMDALDKIVDQTHALLMNQQKRKALIDLGHEVCDGKGAGRIAASIKKCQTMQG